MTASVNIEPGFKVKARGEADERQPAERHAHHADSYALITAKGLAAIREAAPSRAREVRRLSIDRLTPEQIGQLAGIATAVLGNLPSDQPFSSA